MEDPFDSHDNTARTLGTQVGVSVIVQGTGLQYPEQLCKRRRLYVAGGCREFTCAEHRE